MRGVTNPSGSCMCGMTRRILKCVPSGPQRMWEANNRHVFSLLVKVHGYETIYPNLTTPYIYYHTGQDKWGPLLGDSQGLS